MNFSPFYYQVQDIIKKDDDKALRNIFNDLNQRDEFNSYHEDFLHCTYPDSFKCLYFLMNDMNRRYNVHSVLYYCFQNNNEKWLTLFLETLQKKKEEFKSDSIAASILDKNLFVMRMDIDYVALLNSNSEVWNTMFSHHNLELFKPHMLLNEIFDLKQYSKVYLFEELCHTHNFELPIKDILQKSFQENELDIAEYFLEKYQPVFSKEDIADIINVVGLTGNVDNFKFFTQHFLNFHDFNIEQISLVFNAGLIVNKTDIVSYLKEQYSIDFYPLDNKLKSNFLANRHTMWEDNDENSPSSLELLQNVNHLFNIYKWDKEELIKELQPFTELSQLFTKISLNEKLQSKLENKNLSTMKGKI